MTLRTCNIIMCCKGNYGFYAQSRKDAIKKYMAKECGCDTSVYTDEVLHRIIMDALKDYIDGVKKPSYVLWCIEEYGKMYDNLDDKILTMFDLTQVMDDNGYVNGFTEELIKHSEIDLAYNFY